MKIDRIIIENFRSHAKTDVALERFVIVRGANASGKTSFEQAIEFALTGRSDSTGANGQGATDLIRSGQDKGAVTLLTTNGSNIQRELRASLTRKSGRTVTAKVPTDKAIDCEPWLERIAKSRDVLSCLCNNRYFVDLPAKEQKNILAGIVLPDHYEFPAYLTTLFGEAGLSIDWGMHPINLIDSAYKLAFEARTEVNRDLKLTPLPPKPEDGDAVNLDEIRQRVSQRQIELDEARAKKAANASAGAQHRLQYESLRAQIEPLDVKLDTEQREYTAAKGRTLSKKEFETLEKIAARAAEVKALNDNISRFNLRIEQVTQDLESLNEISEEPTCPKCTQPIDADFFKRMVETLTKDKDLMASEVRRCYGELKAIGDPADAQKKLDAHEQAKRDMERHKQRVGELADDIKAVKEKMEALGVPVEVAADPELEATIATLTEKVQKGMKLLQDLGQQAAATEAYNVAFEKRKALELRLARLETLVAYFGPAGIKAELIAEHIGAFQAKMNDVLDGWSYTTKLSIEPYSFLVARHGGEFRELSLLSRSERYRFSVAFQVALAVTTGLRFMVVDELDIFDPESRRLVTGALLGADLDQVILLATDIRTEVTADIPGSTFLFLTANDNGITEARVLKSQPAERVAA